MFRTLISAAKCSTSSVLTAGKLFKNVYQPSLVQQVIRKHFSVLHTKPNSTLLNEPRLIKNRINLVDTKTLTKFSITKGRRKANKAVIKRFYRLNWGIWIRTKCGRHKKLWKKRASRKRRLRQHVFCNATQSYLLDKMVGSYWRKPKYFVDDPYEPYHKREDFVYSARKPRPYFPPGEL